MRAFEILRRVIGPLTLIHEQAGPRLLGLARLGVFALWMVKLLLDPLWRLAEMPREMLRPVGVLNLLPREGLEWLFTAQGLTGLWMFSIAVVGSCLGGSVAAQRPRGLAILYTVAAVLLTVYSSVIRSFGPAVHTDIVLLLAVYALAGFAWADVAEPRAPGRYSYPLITIIAMLCLAYSLVGLNRVVSGGINVFTGDTMEAWAVDASLRGYYFNTNLGWHVPSWPWIAFMLKSGLPVITVFEIMAPLCLASARFRWMFIPVMLSFHALSLVFMNIFFFDDMLLYLLLVDWSRGFPAMRAKVGQAGG
jgi:hypothetical protein